MEVSIARQGAPSAEMAKRIAEKLGPLYPAKSFALNHELSQILLAANAPDAVAKTMKLLEAAPTQEEQIWYVLSLRTIKNGWTPELRKEYLSWWTKDRAGLKHPPEVMKWFADAGRPYADGASFPRFIANFHADAVKTLSPQEQESLKEVIAAYTPPEQRRRPPEQVKPRQLVKAWQMADLTGSLDQAAKGRSFRRGREAYLAAQCAACHKFGNDPATIAGDVGPDLTAVASRFTRRDILESIIEPSKVISEQYMNTAVRLKNGDTVVGRLLEETDDKLVLSPDQRKPEKVTVKKADIDRRVPSKLSPMPSNLADVLTKDEILDLLAYLESGGKRDHPAFAKQ
jgi:putative heme-binding domain-containing protein